MAEQSPTTRRRGSRREDNDSDEMDSDDTVIEPAQEMLEEGLDFLAGDAGDPLERLPQASDSDKTVAEKRNAILGSIVPISLVSLATSNGVLVAGAGKRTGPGLDCYFPMPEYLICAGAVSLSIFVYGVIARYLVDWILGDRTVASGEAELLRGVRCFEYFVCIIQALILISGSFFLFSYLGELTTDVNQKGDPHAKYCDYSLVVFPMVFLSANWIYILCAALCFLYAYCLPEEELDPEEDELEPESQLEGRSNLVTSVRNWQESETGPVSMHEEKFARPKNAKCD